MAYGSSGDSAITAFFTLVFAGVIVALLFGKCVMDGETAQIEAKEYARNFLGVQNARVRCQNIDSGGDGYVSCSVRDLDTGKVYPLQCSGAFTLNEGCAIDTGKNRNGSYRGW